MMDISKHVLVAISSVVGYTRFETDAPRSEAHISDSFPPPFLVANESI